MRTHVALIAGNFSEPTSPFINSIPRFGADEFQKKKDTECEKIIMNLQLLLRE